MIKGLKSIPSVEENEGGVKSRYDIMSYLLKQRIIMISGPIDDDVADLAISQLLYLEAQSPGEDILMHINSPGGSVTAGMAIYDTMNYVASDIVTIGMGMCASMGSFLLSAGAKGKRSCLPNCEVMIHQPLISGGLGGQQTDVMIGAKHLELTRTRLTTLLAKHCDKDFEQVMLDTERDNYLSAKEARDYGLVDTVVNEDK